MREASRGATSAGLDGWRCQRDTWGTPDGPHGPPGPTTRLHVYQLCPSRGTRALARRPVFYRERIREALVTLLLPCRWQIGEEESFALKFAHDPTEKSVVSCTNLAKASVTLVRQ